MTKSKIEPGTVIDGFTIGEQVHSGGMATLWSVTHPGITVPLLMKIPLMSEGEDPAAIVSFEMEQMILPRLSGPHVPGCFGAGDFARQAYVVMERIAGKTLYSRIDELPLAYEEASAIVGKIALALADLHRQNVIHHDINERIGQETRKQVHGIEGGLLRAGPGLAGPAPSTMNS